MYGLSIDTNLDPLVESTLTFVGFGQYQLQLVFLGTVEALISIEGDYSVAPGGHWATRFSEPVAGAQLLLPLLGRTVTSARVPSDGIVRVSFDNSTLLEVLDSSSNYESYQLKLGDRVIVV